MDTTKDIVTAEETKEEVKLTANQKKKLKAKAKKEAAKVEKTE